MRNRIEIKFNRGIYKAFWNNERLMKRKNSRAFIEHRNRLIFLANTKDLAEQRAKDFIESHPGIKGYAFLSFFP